MGVNKNSQSVNAPKLGAGAFRVPCILFFLKQLGTFFDEFVIFFSFQHLCLHLVNLSKVKKVKKIKINKIKYLFPAEYFFYFLCNFPFFSFYFLVFLKAVVTEPRIH